MIDIYRGSIKKLYISGIKLNGESINNLVLSADFYENLLEDNKNVKFVLSERIVSEESLFYRNIFNKYINMEFDNVLADRIEAEDYIQGRYGTDCLFVDYDNLKYIESIDRKALKKLKVFMKR